MKRFLLKKLQPDGEKNNTIDDGFQSKKLIVFSFREIIAATQNFSYDNKIGEGSFGVVYKGRLRNEVLVAVKRLSHNSRQRIKEFDAEVHALSYLRHRNLVQLYGFCVEEENLLVYEYMENHSLASALFGPQPLLNLTWTIRYKICIGIARGLDYLHDRVKPMVVHRDIKADNILLDNDFTAKISDFGLARLYDDEGTRTVTEVGGTLGYMAPEYATRGIVSEKIDVYSYGVLLLEIISGKKNAKYIKRSNKEFFDLLYTALVLHQKGDLLDLVDTTMRYDQEYSEKQANTILNVAMRCINSSASLRPRISHVVGILEGRKVVEPAPTYESLVTNLLRSCSVAPSTNPSTTPINIKRVKSLAQNSSSESSFSGSTYDCKCCGETLYIGSTTIPADIAVRQRPKSSYFRIRETHVSNFIAKSFSLPHAASDLAPGSNHVSNPILRLEGSTRVVEENEEGINVVDNLAPNDPGKSSVLVLDYVVATDTSVTAAAGLDQDNTLKDTIVEKLHTIDPGKIQIEIELETERLDLNELSDQTCKDLRVVEQSLKGQDEILFFTEAHKEQVQAFVQIEVEDDLQLSSIEVGVEVYDTSSLVVGTTKLQNDEDPLAAESSLVSHAAKTFSQPTIKMGNELLQPPSLVDAQESHSKTPSVPMQNAADMGVVAVATSSNSSLLQANFSHICSSAQETQDRVVFERPANNLNQTIELTLPARYLIEGFRQALSAFEPNDVSAMINMARNIFSSLDMMRVDYNFLIDEVETFINACQAFRSTNGATQISALKEHVNQILGVKRQKIEESIRLVAISRKKALKAKDKVATIQARIEELEKELVEACFQAKLSFEELGSKTTLLESLEQEETTLIGLLQEAQEEERRMDEYRQESEMKFILCRDRMKTASL